MCRKYFYNLFFKTLILTIIVSSLIWCQIPNPGFENWTNAAPDNWLTNNTAQLHTVLQSTDAHSGSYSVEGTVVSFSGFSFAPILTSSFPYTVRSSNFSGYYKLTSVGSDTLDIVIALYKNNNAIAGGFFHNSSNINSYTQFNIPITYLSSDIPDSAVISISITPFLNSHGSSTFYIDDLSFSGTATLVNESKYQIPNIFELKQNYPNPFNPSTIIEYSIPENTFVKIYLYDLLGNKIKIIENSFKTMGQHKVELNSNNLSTGIYFYKMETNRFQDSKKLIILK